MAPAIRRPRALLLLPLSISNDPSPSMPPRPGDRGRSFLSPGPFSGGGNPATTRLFSDSLPFHTPFSLTLGCGCTHTCPYGHLPSRSGGSLPGRAALSYRRLEALIPPKTAPHRGLPAPGSFTSRPAGRLGESVASWGREGRNSALRLFACAARGEYIIKGSCPSRASER